MALVRRVYDRLRAHYRPPAWWAAGTRLRAGGAPGPYFERPTAEIRADLLAQRGVGPETADSILLYAGGHPVFVVDAYTHRILGRHNLTNGKPDYAAVRSLFEMNL